MAGSSLSVIIPALNEAACIAQAVRRAFELEPREVIVVDGGSRDGTPERAAECGGNVLRSPPGRAIQQNAAARQSTGKVLLFLHADTWLAADARCQIEQAFADPRVVAGGFRQRIEARGILFRAIEIGNAARLRAFKIAYGDQGICIRRKAFEQLGGFPEVRLMEDLLLSRRMKRLGHVVLLPGPLHVSARRWQRHGVLWQTARNWSLICAHWLGASPDRLAELYRRHDR